MPLFLRGAEKSRDSPKGEPGSGSKRRSKSSSQKVGPSEGVEKGLLLRSRPTGKAFFCRLAQSLDHLDLADWSWWGPLKKLGQTTGRARASVKHMGRTRVWVGRTGTNVGADIFCISPTAESYGFGLCR